MVRFFSASWKFMPPDGQNFSPTPLQVTRNSNGYPIITAAGKEYNQCN